MRLGYHRVGHRAILDRPDHLAIQLCHHMPIIRRAHHQLTRLPARAIHQHLLDQCQIIHQIVQTIRQQVQYTLRLAQLIHHPVQIRHRRIIIHQLARCIRQLRRIIRFRRIHRSVHHSINRALIRHRRHSNIPRVRPAILQRLHLILQRVHYILPRRRLIHLHRRIIHHHHQTIHRQHHRTCQPLRPIYHHHHNIRQRRLAIRRRHRNIHRHHQRILQRVHHLLAVHVIRSAHNIPRHHRTIHPRRQFTHQVHHRPTHLDRVVPLIVHRVCLKLRLHTPHPAHHRTHQVNIHQRVHPILRRHQNIHQRIPLILRKDKLIHRPVQPIHQVVQSKTNYIAIDRGVTITVSLRFTFIIIPVNWLLNWLTGQIKQLSFIF